MKTITTKYFLLLTIIAMVLPCCSQTVQFSQATAAEQSVIVGASQTELYWPLLEMKRVGIVCNQTSNIEQVHLVDSLLRMGITIKAVFAPEHGFRGEAGAGETIKDGKDAKTGLTIYSLYGKTKKPTQEMLKDIDILLFDIQDVGARFYTFISTMHYVMEAASEAKIPVIVLDRPNPNGHYVDGPVLDPKFKSFVGMDPIPIVHGCTVGELAKMINGEGWLANGATCDLSVIACKYYSHQKAFALPTRPSPNLATDKSIALYPSLCLFEGTIVSVGRGTSTPFECIGFPAYSDKSFAFTPRDIDHVVTDPPYENQTCYGIDLSKLTLDDLKAEKRLNLSWLFQMFEDCESKDTFFSSPDFFDKLAGNDQLRKQLLEQKTELEIRESWRIPLEKYIVTRSKYLIYPE
jgi:uncharacterized protein YbbC (DUF1343 family)